MFRWSLNAFLQANKSATELVSKELRSHKGFRGWWPAQQAVIDSDPLLMAFRKGRNLIVHQKSLEIRSSAIVGVFQYRRLKLAMRIDAPIWAHSEDILESVKQSKAFANLLSDEHPAIGEELGIQRSWKAVELGEEEILTNCDTAFMKIARIVSDAHKFCGFNYPISNEHFHDATKVSLLTESDADPTSPKKWGWI